MKTKMPEMQIISDATEIKPPLVGEILSFLEGL